MCPKLKDLKLEKRPKGPSWVFAARIGETMSSLRYVLPLSPKTNSVIFCLCNGAKCVPPPTRIHRPITNPWVWLLSPFPACFKAGSVVRGRPHKAAK